MNHSIVIEKLIYHVVRCVAEIWVKRYLNDRKQFVKTSEFSSDVLNVSCGVPPDSVLGPKLFTLYINDTCNVPQLLQLVLFADDTNISYSDADVNILISLVNLNNCIHGSM